MDSAIYFKYREFRQLFRHKNQNIEVFLQTYEKLKEEIENDYVKSFSTDQKDILEMLYVCNLDISLIEKIMIQHQTKSEVRNELLLLDTDHDTRASFDLTDPILQPKTEAMKIESSPNLINFTVHKNEIDDQLSDSLPVNDDGDDDYVPSNNNEEEDGSDDEYQGIKREKKHNTKKYKKTSNGRFLCDDCGKDFSRANSIPMHKKKYCSKQFEIPAEVNDFTEMKIKKCETRAKKIPFEKNSQGRYICNTCGKDFKLGVDVLYHKNKTTCSNFGSNKFECFYCDDALDSLDLHTLHMKSSHPEKVNLSITQRIEKRKEFMKQLVKCDLCEKYYSNAHIKKHISDVHKGHKVPCPTCGKMISRKHWREHKLIHDQETAEKLMCDKCDYTTFSQVRMKSHYVVNHGPKNFSCDICGKSFGTKAILKGHIVGTHNEELKCDLCDYTTTNSFALEKHKSTRHRENVNFVCTLCPFETQNQSSLLTHYSDFHGIEEKVPKKTKKNYDCDLCDFKGNGKNVLRVHKEVNHLGIKYPCEQCDFISTTKGSLKRHVEQRHLGIKHPCKFCDFQASTKSSCRQHMYTKHPNEYIIYSCHLCNYKTENKDLLHRHLTGKYGKHNT